MTVGIQEVLLYYVSAFVRPPIQTPLHFKLVENTLALPIPKKVKPGKKPNKNNKTKQKIPLKTPTKTKQKNHLETGTNIHNFKWRGMDCVFFLLVLVFFAFLCRDMLKKCHPPACTNQIWVFSSLHSSNSWCRQDWRYLVFKDDFFSVLVWGLLVFCFLFEAGMSYIGWYSHILFFFTLPCICASLVFFSVLHILNPRNWASSVENSDMYKI